MRQDGPRNETLPRPDQEPVPTRVPYSFVHINKCGGSSIEIALGLPKRHATAMALRDDIGAEAWERQFSFSVVRNPFDRVVSIYYFRLRRNYQGLGDRHVTINHWVEAVWQDGAAQYNDWPLLNKPATEWLVDENGTLAVEYVARLEDIESGWAQICARLGIDVALPVLNANLRPAYRDVLTPASRAIIEEAFAADLDRFDYDY